MPVTLMSFNTQHCMNYITKEVEYDSFAEEIRRHNADIIGLNEVYDQCDSGKFPAQVKILAEKLGYYYYFAQAVRFKKQEPYGNGILSRFPIISAETILIPKPEIPAYSGYYESRCLLKAKIDVCGGLEVGVIHFGLNQDEKENAVNAILTNIGDKKSVLMGDFNITPDNPLLIPIKEKMFDTAALFKQELLSFPSDNPNRKIDYLFTSRDIKVLDADIPADIVSDHRPLITVIAD